MSESCVICNENGDDLWEGFDDCSKCVSTKQHNERIKHLDGAKLVNIMLIKMICGTILLIVRIVFLKKNIMNT